MGFLCRCLRPSCDECLMGMCFDLKTEIHRNCRIFVSIATIKADLYNLQSYHLNSWVSKLTKLKLLWQKDKTNRDRHKRTRKGK